MSVFRDNHTIKASVNLAGARPENKGVVKKYFKK